MCVVSENEDGEGFGEEQKNLGWTRRGEGLGRAGEGRKREVDVKDRHQATGVGLLAAIGMKWEKFARWRRRRD